MSPGHRSAAGEAADKESQKHATDSRHARAAPQQEITLHAIMAFTVTQSTEQQRQAPKCRDISACQFPSCTVITDSEQRLLAEN